MDAIASASQIQSWAQLVFFVLASGGLGKAYLLWLDHQEKQRAHQLALASMEQKAAEEMAKLAREERAQIRADNAMERGLDRAERQKSTEAIHQLVTTLERNNATSLAHAAAISDTLGRVDVALRRFSKSNMRAVQTRKAHADRA